MSKPAADVAQRPGLTGRFWAEVRDLFERTWTLGLTLVLVTVACAGLYYLGSFNGWGIVAAFEDKTEVGEYAGISFLDCLYFSAVTVTTLGFGDYLPLSYARLVAGSEALVGVILIGVFVSRLVSKHQEHLTKTVLHGEFNGERRKLRGRVKRMLREFEREPLLLVKEEPSADLRRLGVLMKTMARYWTLEKEDPAFERLVLKEDAVRLMEGVAGLLGVVEIGVKRCGELNGVDARRVKEICAGAVTVAGVFESKLKGQEVERACGRVREAVEKVGGEL